ncbi:hypothetical protein C8D92_104101 [Tamilnaduibacter salinus]|uniref:Uncharacterized protein n=1 Tax=Tamilnaduibacter salinus TaxID=1484056 RepID=A0A2U1CX91_9GAMM|nr:helix-turn-helix transcriptional regulator [Tamilnaduibacter salinus]PVY76870.1 hypothetical protein C8D92_104101 [Tamilnaduibacter salinus]
MARQAINAAILGHRLKALRQATYPSRQAFSNESGIPMRTLARIESGDDGVSLGRYLKAAKALEANWLLDIFPSHTEATFSPPEHYLTGASALCLTGKNGHPALWYSSSLSNLNDWQIAGRDLSSTNHLLGALGIFDGSHMLRFAGIDVPTVWVANHERALFDYLHHFLEIKRTQVPNIQLSDIDDVVDVRQTADWVELCSGFLSPEGRSAMRGWLGQSCG